MKKYTIPGFVISMAILVASCNMGSDGKNENAYDSLFLGISLGMEKKAFYDHCWEYNRRKIFTHGPSNQNVEYLLATELNAPVSMRFYPIFRNSKIFEMGVTFNYQAWAPWNRQYQSDSLIKNLVPLFQKWYGGEFKEIHHPEMGHVYYRIDGKRRINLYIKDEQFVRAVYTDLKVEKELEEEFKKDQEKAQQ